MNSNLTVKETMYNIAKMESDYFIKQLFDFDYTSLAIAYHAVLNDRYKPHTEQLYADYNGSGLHLFLYRMEIQEACDLVACTMKAYQRQKNISFILNHFKNILDKYPTPFIELLNKRYCL